VGFATKTISEKKTNYTPKTTVTYKNTTPTKIAPKPPVENNTKENKTEDKSEEKLLDITGEIIFTINDMDIEIKENIEDYAKILSVTFTIKNQDKDFTPKVIGYLEKYGSDDEKIIELDELIAGKSITRTDKKLTFGFNEIDEEQILILELYNGKKRLQKVTKSFKA